MLAGKKFKRPLKKKYRDDEEGDFPKNKNKHHDKTTWRLARNEEKEYGL